MITASAQLENCGITHPTENRRYMINESKNATLLVDWLKVTENSENTKYLPSDVSYELANFEEFMEKCQELMSKALKFILLQEIRKIYKDSYGR